jgi:acyl dehydratase
MLGEGLYFEELLPGRTFKTEKRTITEADLVSFIAQCGFFEPMFMDQEFIETGTAFKRRIAPGVLSLAYAEGLTVLSGLHRDRGMALLGLELQILKPVFIGNTSGVEIEVIEKRETQKLDRGIITFLHRVRNQKDELVMEYKAKRMIRRKPGNGVVP